MTSIEQKLMYFKILFITSRFGCNATWWRRNTQLGSGFRNSCCTKLLLYETPTIPLLTLTSSQTSHSPQSLTIRDKFYSKTLKFLSNLLPVTIPQCLNIKKEAKKKFFFQKT